MHVTVTRPVAAGAAVVWALLEDVERWPTWTRSMRSVELDGPFALGAVATIRQPRLPVARWRITEIDPGRSFTWSATGVGVHAMATHEVAPAAAGTSRITLTFDQTGALAGPLRLLLGGLTRRYLTMEADGLAAAAALQEGGGAG